jgi:hypothetical protein
MIDPGFKPKPNGAKRSKCVKTCHTTEFDVIEYAPRPAMNYEPIPPLTGLTLIKYLPIDLRNLGVDNVRDVEYETAVLVSHLASRIIPALTRYPFLSNNKDLVMYVNQMWTHIHTTCSLWI